MAEEKKDLNVDSSETQNTFSVLSKNKFWKDDYELEDFIELFRVDGKARKACNKFVGDLASKAWKSNSSPFEKIRKDIEFDNYIRYATQRAFVGGVAFIYLGFNDQGEYNEPVSTKMVPDFLKVIPSSNIEKDEYKKAKYDKTTECYSVFKKDGTTMAIHESRILMIKLNEDQDSMFRPAMRSFQVTSSMLWSFGQASFRMAAGLTHVTIKNPKPIRSADGSIVTNEVDKVKKDGVFSTMNAETAYVSDDRYNVDVKGVQGGRISPRDYWDVAIENLSIDLQIPKQIFKGENAGSIAGSETNVRDYISDITELREDFMIFVVNQFAEKVGLPPITIEFETLWQPTDDELMDSMNKASDALKKFTEAGMDLQSGVDYVNKILGTEFKVGDFPEAQKASDALKNDEGITISQNKTSMTPTSFIFDKNLFSEIDVKTYLDNRGHKYGWIDGESEKVYTVWIYNEGEVDFQKEILFDVEEGVKAFYAPMKTYFDSDVKKAIQTLIFSKEEFTKAEVKKWIKDHDQFTMTKEIDEKENTYRVRQRNPKDFDETTFITINITKGVKAVYGTLLKSKQDANKKSKSIYNDKVLIEFERKVKNKLLNLFKSSFDFKNISKVIKGSVYFDSLMPKRRFSEDAEKEGFLVIEQEATKFDSAVKIYMAGEMPKGFDLAYVAAQGLSKKKTEMSEETKNIRNYIKDKSFNDVTGVTEDMKKDLRRVLQDAIENEKTPKAAAKAFNKYVDDDFANKYKNRLKIIAEQETIDVLNDAAVNQYKDAGIKKHEWLDAGDEKVRPEHRKANGEIVKIGDKFPYVNVTRAPAGVGCRCTTLPVLEEE